MKSNSVQFKSCHKIAIGDYLLDVTEATNRLDHDGFVSFMLEPGLSDDSHSRIHTMIGGRVRSGKMLGRRAVRHRATVKKTLVVWYLIKLSMSRQIR